MAQESFIEMYDERMSQVNDLEKRLKSEFKTRLKDRFVDQDEANCEFDNLKFTKIDTLNGYVIVSLMIDPARDRQLLRFNFSPTMSENEINLRMTDMIELLVIFRRQMSQMEFIDLGQYSKFIKIP